MSIVDKMVSFCIITDGRDPDLLRMELESIHSQNIPKYEIIICGNTINVAGLINSIIYFPEAAHEGRLGAMRNRACRQARGKILVVSDDDMRFESNWYKGLIEYGNNFDVLCGRLINPDGSRYWDWATHGGPHGHRLLRYDETDDHIYVTGGLCVMKRYVFENVQWDETRGFYQLEDVDFSRRVQQAGFTIKFNIHSTVVHLRPSWGSQEPGE